MKTKSPTGLLYFSHPCDDGRVEIWFELTAPLFTAWRFVRDMRNELGPIHNQAVASVIPVRKKGWVTQSYRLKTTFDDEGKALLRRAVKVFGTYLSEQDLYWQVWKFDHFVQRNRDGDYLRGMLKK